MALIVIVSARALRAAHVLSASEFPARDRP
jgi:hypothetical protein